MAIVVARSRYYAVYYCVKVSWALDQRLVPLNKDRAFVADSLVRAAFELGNPDSPVLGVDPHTEQAGGGGPKRAAALNCSCCTHGARPCVQA